LLDDSGYLPMTEAEVYANAKPADVEQEFRAQIEKARQAGIPITHVDSHMSAVFGSKQLFEVYRRVAEEYGLLYLLPRRAAMANVAPANAVIIDREIQMQPGIEAKEWLAWYKRELAGLPAGVYQLVVHLGYDDEEARGAAENRNWGGKWRQTDWDTVRNPDFAKFLREQNFILISWTDLVKAARP
jgi:predicted glycoside hydrolase/deacetylase ChbG (UPF0249 family)